MYVVEFVGGYGFEVQNKVRSMHWHSHQISILVHIGFHHNLAPDPYDEDLKILTEYQFYISNNCKHDLEFVQHCFKLH